MRHRSASGNYTLPFRVGSLRTQRESKEELWFGLKHGRLVADMADKTVEPGDRVTLESTNWGRECWASSSIESRSQTLRDNTGKILWSEILRGAWIIVDYSFQNNLGNSNNVIPNKPSDDFSGAGSGNLCVVYLVDIYWILDVCQELCKTLYKYFLTQSSDDYIC